MKKIVLIIVFVLSGPSAFAQHYVNGYTKSNGTYVPGHMSAERNEYRYDNPSSKSQGGSQRDEFSAPSATNKKNSSWGSSDNDNDGIPNSLDRYPNSKKNGW